MTKDTSTDFHAAHTPSEQPEKLSPQPAQAPPLPAQSQLQPPSFNNPVSTFQQTQQPAQPSSQQPSQPQIQSWEHPQSPEVSTHPPVQQQPAQQPATPPSENVTAWSSADYRPLPTTHGNGMWEHSQPMITPVPFSVINDVSQWQPPQSSGAPGSAGAYPYHRLFRSSPQMRWWKPIPAVLLGILTALVFTFILSIFFFLAGLLSDDGEMSVKTLEQTVPIFALVIVFLPAFILWLAVFRMPITTVFSVTKRLRWKWLRTCAAVSAAIFLVMTCINLALAHQLSPSTWTPLPGVEDTLKAAVISALLLLILIPLQSFTEEFVYRGIAMQAIGTWLKHPAWAIVIQAILFAISHAYDTWALASVFLFGLALGYLTWRTGGIEAGVALHVINNVITMILQVFIDGKVVVSGSGKPLDLVIELGILFVYVAIIEWLWRRQVRREISTIQEDEADTPHSRKKTGIAITPELIVEPQFPNRVNDPNPMDLGVAWTSDRWSVGDPRRFAEGVSRYSSAATYR